MMVNLSVKRSQLLLAASIGVGLCILTGAGLYYLGKDATVLSPSQAQKKTPIEMATGKIDPHEIWRFKLEGAMKDNKQKVDLLEKMMGESLKATQNQGVSAEASEEVSQDRDSGGIEELRQEIFSLKEQLNTQEQRLQGGVLPVQESLVGNSATDTGVADTSVSVPLRSLKWWSLDTWRERTEKRA